MEEIAMQEGVYDDEPHGRELVWAMLANRAARGLASLRVQNNEMTLEEAGADVVRSASKLQGARELLDALPPDCVVLELKLGDEFNFQLANLLV